MANKCVIYLDGVSRGIVLTDHDQQSIDELTNKISTAMAGNSICELKTKTDTLVVRPSQITAIHIQGGPRVGSAKPAKKEEETNIADIVPELDLGDDLDEVVEPQEEIIVKDDVVVEDDVVVDEQPEEEIVEDDVEDVISEVEAWHSEVEDDTSGSD